MHRPPFISVIVPVYNSENTISVCIESLLNQDYPKDRYEVIVVDNGSTDNTRKTVEWLAVSGDRLSGNTNINTQTENRKPKTVNLHYVYEPVRGSYKARNTGIEQASGEILAFTDADCVVDKEWLKRGVEAFSDEKVGCAAGEIEGYEPKNYIEEYLCDKKELSQKKTLEEALMPYAKTANVFYRKQVFDKIGLFEEKWVSGGDADIAWRMQIETDYKIKYMADAKVLHKHRSTLSSMFKQCAKWGVGRTLLFKKYKDRMKVKTLRQDLWIVGRIVFLLLAVIPFLLSKKSNLSPDVINKNLDRVSFLGWEIGRLAGSLKSGVLDL